MDRPVTYFGQVPRSLDVLTVGQDAMVGLAKLSEAILGTAVAVAGFACTGTTPASLNIVVGPGQVYEVENLEATTVSGLQVDTHQILKQGVNLDPTTLTLVPPATVGFAVNVLIEAQYADADTGQILLTFQNSSAPGQTFQGPGGNGQQSNTVRKGVATLQSKYGTPATAGQQTTPTPDPGFVGIAVVTLAYGQTTITSTNIAPYNGNASYIPTTLTGVPAGVLSGAWAFGTASGTNAYTATLFSTAAYPFALTTGMEILVYFGSPNTTTTPTLNANGSGAKSIVKQGAGAPAAGDLAGFMALIYDGVNWRINGLVASDVQVVVQNGIGFASFTTTGTYTFTVPAGVTKVNVRVWAGGGGSNASGSSTIFTAGAGGAGYSQKLINGLVPGQQITVTVGAGGAAAGAGSTGGNGGTSSFGNYCSASGGPGASATSTSGVAGGLGISGDDNRQGEGGGGSISSTKAGDGGGGGGGGGARAPGGNGGTNPGNFPGGGAAGAPPNTAGAAGAGGYVYITWGGAS